MQGDNGGHSRNEDNKCQSRPSPRPRRSTPAADLIEKRGWAQGHVGLPHYSDYPWGNREDDTSPVCLEGGIAAAIGWPLDGASCQMPKVGFESCPAYLAVAEYLELNNGGRPYEFNDADDRTAAEVVEVLRAAAAIEQAREHEAARVTA